MLKTSREGCASKDLYFDQHEARMGALRIKDKYGKRMDEYKCNVCGYWHLTSFYENWARRKLADRHV